MKTIKLSSLCLAAAFAAGSVAARDSVDLVDHLLPPNAAKSAEVRVAFTSRGSFAQGFAQVARLDSAGHRELAGIYATDLAMRALKAGDRADAYVLANYVRQLPDDVRVRVADMPHGGYPTDRIQVLARAAGADLASR